MKIHVALMTIASCCAGTANGEILNFDGDVGSHLPDGSGAFVTPFDGMYINRTYGDIPAELDVSYIDRRIVLAVSDIDRGISGQTLRYWDADYNDLRRVVWGGTSDANSAARVALTPLNGRTIRLHSFDLGGWPNTTHGTTLNVYEIGSAAPLFTYIGNIGIFPGNLANHFSDTSFNSIVSSTGFLIDWEDSAFNVGLDNVDFTVSAIPLPAAFWLFGTAFAGLGFLRRVGDRSCLK